MYLIIERQFNHVEWTCERKLAKGIYKANASGKVGQGHLRIINSYLYSQMEMAQPDIYMRTRPED